MWKLKTVCGCVLGARCGGLLRGDDGASGVLRPLKESMMVERVQPVSCRHLKALISATGFATRLRPGLRTAERVERREAGHSICGRGWLGASKGRLKGQNPFSGRVAPEQSPFSDLLACCCLRLLPHGSLSAV